MITIEELEFRLNDFINSKQRAWGIIGERYYRVENDIITLKTGNEELNKADERLAHSTYRNLVDEKVSFLFAKEPVISIGNMADSELEQVSIIRNLLGKGFQNKLIQLGVDASNKIVGWLQPYIDGEGNLKWHIHDALYVHPVWIDKQERELEYVIVVFYEEKWNQKDKTFDLIKHININTAEGIYSYFENDKKELQSIGFTGYFTIEGEQYNWGRVPFIPFYNTRDEISDIQLIKTLIDAYDLGRSESQNFIEDIRNFIMVLKGYNGDALDELIATVKKYGALAVDSDGGVDSLSPNMNITDTLSHFQLLKRDLYENAQGVNRDIGSIGSNPTNLTLKFLFAGLHLKADKLEAEFKQSFSEMIEFIKKYCEIKSIPLNLNDDVKISFNRDMAMNESELIKDINASVDLSLKTRLEMHPFVDNVEDELDKIRDDSPFRPVPLEENESSE